MNLISFKSFHDEMEKIAVDAATLRNFANFAAKQKIPQAHADRMLKGMIAGEGARMSAVSGIHAIPPSPSAAAGASGSFHPPSATNAGTVNQRAPRVNTGPVATPQPSAFGTAPTQISARPKQKPVPVFPPKAMPPRAMPGM